MRQLDWLLRRLVPLLPVIVILTCATFAAGAARDLFTAKSERPREGEIALGEKTLPAPAAPAAPAARKDADAVSERNVLCEGCTPEPAPPEPEPEPEPAPVVKTPPPATQLPLVLVGTTVPKHGEASATIADARSTWGGLYRRGDVIPGAGPVVAVSGRWVDFENRAAGRVERLDLLGAPPPRQPPPPSPGGGPREGASAQPQNPRAALQAELDAGITKVNDTSFQVSRALFDKVMADPSLVAGAARVAPAKGGKGMTLSYVRAGSAPEKLGLKKGDTLMAINGYEVSQNYDKLFEMWSKLKSASTFSIEVERGGKTVTLGYTVK